MKLRGNTNKEQKAYFELKSAAEGISNTSTSQFLHQSTVKVKSSVQYLTWNFLVRSCIYFGIEK